MGRKYFDIVDQQIIMTVTSLGFSSRAEIVVSSIFKDFLNQFFDYLEDKNALILDELGDAIRTKQGRDIFIELVIRLQKNTLEEVLKLVDGSDQFSKNPNTIQQFVEDFYNYWRSFDRYMVLESQPGSTSFEHRPYRAFNMTVQAFQESIRGLYRDVSENITGDHPDVYRQVNAGTNVGMIAIASDFDFPTSYASKLHDILVLRQVLINPPMILNPPMNKRAGRFEKISVNPLENMELDKDSYLCYPIQVGPLVILVYFHKQFIGLASSMANLFDLATDEQLLKRPDAIFVYGAPVKSLSRFGDIPTVFFDDEKNNMLSGFVPLEDRFGYFGYVKKMILTLHNIVMMKRGLMPFHGALSRIHLNNGKDATLLLIGDTATGKSETLEALRLMGEGKIRALTVIADDMGSLEIADDGSVIGYGTETGAFIRLDDLQQGYAFGQIDRAIIMSPHQTNARVILPITTLENVLHGYKVDMVLYANNYEEVDESHPIVDEFKTAKQALKVFKDGYSMAKGTTTSSGLGQSYFANIFGPPQYMEIHDKLAERTFDAIIKSGAFVGQMRTRLGIKGFESKGPLEASTKLLKMISEMLS